MRSGAWKSLQLEKTGATWGPGTSGGATRGRGQESKNRGRRSGLERQGGGCLRVGKVSRRVWKPKCEVLPREEAGRSL